jgi:transcriptional regulator with XRE-family HTH domain
MTFSDKVKRSREIRQMTQQQLADAVGVSKRTIASYESDGARARSSTMRKLAAALNVSYDYLSKDEIEDPMHGIEKAPYVEEARALYGGKAAAEIDALMERNTALFAGGELSQEAKDAYFEAVMKAYLACKEEARKTFGRKKS